MSMEMTAGLGEIILAGIFIPVVIFGVAFLFRCYWLAGHSEREWRRVNVGRGKSWS